MQQSAADEAAKQRIISHMNKDHHDSIVRYLEHYAKLPSWTAYDGVMADISLDSMSMTCGSRTHRIPFDPRMASYRDARERVVQMDKECLEALGRSDITVRDFVPPTGLYALVFAIIATTFVCYSQRRWFEQNGLVEHLLGRRFAAFSWTIQPTVFYGMIAIHGAELAYFIPNYLQKHSVNVRSTLFWKWAFFVFVEGQFAYKRFNDLVQLKTEEKQKQKH